MKKPLALLLALALIGLALAADPDRAAKAPIITEVALEDIRLLIVLSVVGGVSRVIFAETVQRPLGGWYWLREWLRGCLTALALIALLIALNFTGIFVLMLASLFSGLEPKTTLELIRSGVSRLTGGNAGGKSP